MTLDIEIVIASEAKQSHHDHGHSKIASAIKQPRNDKKEFVLEW